MKRLFRNHLNTVRPFPEAGANSTVYLYFIFVMACLVSCKKMVVTELPDNQEAVYFNFYPASDVFSTYIKPATYTAIYIDRFTPNSVISNNSSFPSFYYATNGVTYDYPSAGSNSNVVVYSPYIAGGHRVMFTDTTRTVVLDTTINQSARSYTCLYFTDAPAAVNAPAKYKMVAVQEDRSGIAPGQVGVRFIHLSADVGTLVCSRQKADGSLTNASSADLHFGETSPYQYFTAADTVSGLLRFSFNNPANGASVVTAVPYVPGRKYAILISGFLNDQQRQIITGKNPDGSARYQSISIINNLRAAIRRIY